MQQIFKDEIVQQQFDSKGFVLLDAGLDNEVNRLQGFINSNFGQYAGQIYYSLMANDYATNMVIKDRIRTILSPFYEKYFANYRSLTESFLVKPASTADELFLHQDWCYTNEAKHYSLTVWIPLEDVDEQNGTLFFLPGSHRWFNVLRSLTLPTGRIASSNGLLQHIEKVNVKKGQAVVFHSGAFHGSYPNQTNRDRIVVTANVLEKDSPFLYYQKASETTANVFHLDDNTLLRELSTLVTGVDPTSPMIETIPYQHKVLTREDFEGHL